MEIDVAMERAALRSLSYNLSTLMSSELVECILHFLYNTKTLTKYECTAIRAKPLEGQKATELVLTVWRKGNRACIKFFQALECYDPTLSTKLTGRPAKLPTVSAAVTVGCNSLPLTSQGESPDPSLALRCRAKPAAAEAKPVTASGHSVVPTTASQGVGPTAAAPRTTLAPTAASQVPSPSPDPFASNVPASSQAMQSSIPPMYVYIMNAKMTNCIIGHGSQLHRTYESESKQQCYKTPHGEETRPLHFENPALSNHMDAIRTSKPTEPLDVKIINSEVQCMIAGKDGILRIEEEVSDEESGSEDDNLDSPTEDPS
ncbi:uncharacterized protein LOC122798333 isoform X1 [Protopterus annectens]|uniref:uncharacterized protein LOC122798333 isoform X1 n=1 Tax=Protopterus annectens TaxID=7888 RepID=UPI001CFADE3A|nr:uncharacterized protein LOC122798333 isoform X1 [Protopterus annectens]